MATGNDVFLLRLNYVDTADRMTCVLAYQSSASSSTDPEGDATKLANAWDTANRAAWLACFPVSTQYTSVSARRVNDLGGPSFYGPVGVGVVGSALADQKVDAAIAALLTCPYNDSDVGGPSKYRVGRVFVGCVPFNFLVDNSWSSAAISAYSALATALSTPVTTSGPTFTPVVWSRLREQYTPAVTYTFQPTIAALRKRQFPAR